MKLSNCWGTYMKFYEKHKNAFVFTFIMATFVYFFVWSILKPYNYGPDEYGRFPTYYYIFLYNKIPDGWNELIRNPYWGFSYAFYLTWLPGLLSVFCMKIVAVFNDSMPMLIYAARFPSVIAGTLCVFCAYGISDKLIKKEHVKWLVTILFASIPQIAFLSSYVSNDMIATAGAMLIVYMLVTVEKEGVSLKSSLPLAAGIIMVALSYYNAYGWIVCAFVYYCIYWIRHKDKRKETLENMLIISAVVLFFTGIFVVRNALIYNGDIFGIKTLTQSSEMYAIDSLKPSARDTLKNQGKPIWVLLFSLPFLFDTAASFFAAFSFAFFRAPLPILMIYFVTFFAGFVLALIKLVSIIRKKDKKTDYTLSILVTLSGLFVIFLMVDYSWGTDYQPQGRYLYPILPALVCMMCVAADYLFEKLDKIFNKNTKHSVRRSIIVSASAAVVFVGISLFCFFGVYVPSNFELAGMEYLETLKQDFANASEGLK